MALGPLLHSSSPGRTARLPWRGGCPLREGPSRLPRRAWGGEEALLTGQGALLAVAGEASQWQLCDGSQSPRTQAVGTSGVPVPLKYMGHHGRPAGACGPHQGRPQGWGLKTSD